MGDLLKVMDPKYTPKNEYERTLRWLGALNKILIENAELGDSELENMARALVDYPKHWHPVRSPCVTEAKATG